jgi:hypothetical protein
MKFGVDHTWSISLAVANLNKIMWSGGFGIITDFTREICFEDLIFEEQSYVNYPGKIAKLAQSDTDKLFSRLEFFFQKEVCSKSFKVRLRKTCGENFNNFKSFVHADPYDFNAITYLSCDGEKLPTRFLEHVKSRRRSFSRESSKEFYICQMLLEHHSTMAEEWEDWIIFRLNKMETLVFDSSYFHAGPSLDGNSSERLTLECFGRFL